MTGCNCIKRGKGREASRTPWRLLRERRGLPGGLRLEDRGARRSFGHGRARTIKRRWLPPASKANGSRASVGGDPVIEGRTVENGVLVGPVAAR
jgi:hypothetical protein